MYITCTTPLSSIASEHLSAKLTHSLVPSLTPRPPHTSSVEFKKMASALQATRLTVALGSTQPSLAPSSLTKKASLRSSPSVCHAQPPQPPRGTACGGLSLLLHVLLAPCQLLSEPPQDSTGALFSVSLSLCVPRLILDPQSVFTLAALLFPATGWMQACVPGA